MTSYKLFSDHVTMVTNFENFQISSGFILNFRKSQQVIKCQLKNSKSYGEKTEGEGP